MPADYHRTDTILWGSESDYATDGNHPRDCGALVFTMDTSSVDELASDVSTPWLLEKRRDAGAAPGYGKDFEIQTYHEKNFSKGWGSDCSSITRSFLWYDQSSMENVLV